MYLKRDVKKFQEGGAVDPAMAGGAPAPETDAAAAGAQGGAPAGPSPEQVMQIAQEAVSQMGPEIAMAVAQAIMEIVQGGGAPAGPAPAGPEPQFQRRGGKMVRVR